MSNHPYQCRDCGSKDIEIQVWLNLNTGKTRDDGGNEDAWCNECEELTKLIKITWKKGRIIPTRDGYKTEKIE